MCKKPIYRVKAWSENFEIGKSKDVERKTYQTFPLKQNGLGYLRVVDHSKVGERIYGCFVAMIITLGHQLGHLRDGWLTVNGEPDGEPFTARDLALKCGMTEEGMQMMLDKCCGPEVDWIELHGKKPKKPRKQSVPKADLEESEKLFEKFRDKYPGTKRGLNTEFDNFKRHIDWKRIAGKLEGILLNQILDREKRRKSGDFVPPWKHLKTYINQRCWEESTSVQLDIDTKKQKDREKEKALKVIKELAGLLVRIRADSDNEDSFWKNVKRDYGANFERAKKKIEELCK